MNAPGLPAAPLDLTVGAPAAGGACVARAPDGRVVFVRHALPGERVLAQVTGAASSYLRADAVSVRSPSEHRVPPPCPHAGPGRCGGCDWQHVVVPHQRLLKAALVEEQLRRLAGVAREVLVEEVPGAPDGLGWRTRVQFAASAQGELGLHRHRSHELERVDVCPIAAPGVTAVGAPQASWPGASVVEVACSADGAQRVVSVTGRRRGAAAPPGELAAGLVCDGRPVRSPHGLRHEVLGRAFDVSAGGFWQVHPGAPEALARAVLEGLAPRAGDRVVDLYAGAGLFAALLGDAVGPTGSVLAVEGDRRAAADCARNTADLRQVRVRCLAVDEALIAHRVGRPDLVVLDPPRAGAGLAVTGALARLRPRRLAYVACDPASFARDLRVLLDDGWSLASLRAFDAFPMTEHVELVAVLDAPA